MRSNAHDFIVLAALLLSTGCVTSNPQRSTEAVGGAPSALVDDYIHAVLPATPR
ncbi:hypothetical protein [Archangium violaceum]|uniref:hypothetical protein n=1 Tax=Archangium violaceum TaxID=83451 RepID=UPI0037BEF935